MSHSELQYNRLHGEMPGGDPAAENTSACELCTEQLHSTSQYRQQKARCHLEPHTPQAHPHEQRLPGMQQPQDMATAVNDVQHHDQEQELPQRSAPDLHEQHCRPFLLQLPPSTSQEERILRTTLQSPGLEHLLQGVNNQFGLTAVSNNVQASPLQKGGYLGDPQGELLRKLHGLNLGEQDVQEKVYSSNEEQQLHPHLHTHGNVKLFSTDIKYPEALATEESPRRRALSLPWNSIPEVDVEEEEDSLMCCCKLKKKVKFADSIGLTLASVKHFLPSDEPLVPKAVLARLQSYPPTVCVQRANLEEEMYCAEWVPPSIIPAELLTRLNEEGVCLEQVSSSSWGVRGCVLVKAPEKKVQVKIRYTFNEWLSFLDCLAFAAKESVAPFHVPGTQRFQFNLNYPPSTSCIHFAICLNTGDGQELWDNNKGVNYTVSFQQDPLPEAHSSSPEQEEWGGSQLW